MKRWRRPDLGRNDLAGPRTAVIIGTGIGGMTTIDQGLYHYYVDPSAPIL